MTDLAHDAPDDGFHEIQLSGKQLVFLFMATTVVSVVIFLCGVLVGRGVRGEPGVTLSAAANNAPPASASGPTASAPAAPPSEAPMPADGDLSYKKRLESEQTPAETLKNPKSDASPAPTASAAAPPVADTPAAAPAPAATVAAKQPEPAATVAAKQSEKVEKLAQGTAGTSEATVKKPGIWAVQVVALTDQAAADAVVRRLSSKGYPAFLVRPQATSPVQNYKVQVGKFEDRIGSRIGGQPTQARRAVPALDSSLALLSGVLLTLSFPKFGHPAFAWVALTPLIVALVRPATPRTTRSACLLGLLTGAGYFAGTLYWLVETMTTFGGLALPVAILVAGLLVAYLSLFPAAFAMVVARLRRSLGVRGAVLCAAPVWVATELGRQYVWDGFPWALLGYSQVAVLPVAQLASLTGVYGLSLVLALVASAVALLLVERLDRRSWTIAAVVVMLVAICALWGQWRIAQSTLTSAGEPLRVAVVQGNIAQDDKWNPALQDVIIGRYLALTRVAVSRGAKFVLWPESSFPVYFEDDIRGHLARRLARENDITILLGSDQLERVQPGAPADAPENRQFNAAFLIRPDGTTADVYRKMHLVPFGEYVPMQRLLFFVGPIVDAVSAFSPGTRAVLLPVGDHKVSTAICYEVIYGSLMRQFVREGSELLTTITNDGWYGRTSAAYQHWDQAAMRAIENGRYLARAANTGVSGFVDPYGRVIQKSKVFEQDVLVQDVRMLKTRTVYTAIGDAIAWLSLAFTIAALVASWRMR